MTISFNRLLCAVACLLPAMSTWGAAPTAATYTAIQAIPPNIQSTPAKPLVMINLSRDHQLFYRAYNEFSDYDGDGAPDGTYLHTVRYSGYFDTTKCYTYNNTDKVFSPSGLASGANKLCTGKWHGNFLNWATMTRIDVLRKVLYGGSRSTDTGTATVLERAALPMDAHSFAKYYDQGASATSDRPLIKDITPYTTETEISLCSTTWGGNTAVSHTVNEPPLMRVAKGNFALWNANERMQCRWSEEASTWANSGSGNGNNPTTTGYPASGSFPSRTSHGLSGATNSDFVVRVKVCVAGEIGAERCKGYPDGNLKPIGLLQEYGENNSAEFGLLTGSFSNNVTAGVLRKNAESFRNEVNYTTNGTFTNPTNGIVRFLDKLRVYGFDYNTTSYRVNDNDFRTDKFCAYQTIGLQNGMCASWGNPLGEMYIETLRYLGGKTATHSSDAKGATMGLTVATWSDPLGDRGTTHRETFGKGQCRPINVLNVNASVISYDGDETSPIGDVMASGQSLTTFTNAIGTAEGINGSARFIGNSGSVNDSTCTSKTLGQLASSFGLCPLAPAYKGSFSMAGAAYWANTNPVRTVPSGLTGLDLDRAFKIKTYAIALAPGVPRITVTATGGKKAVIQPAYRLDLGGGSIGAGTMVDFRVISQSATSGKYLIMWEDSEQGGDYDMDMIGILEWSLTGSTLKVTTRAISEATGTDQGFGYTISGTNRDGVHFHSGIEGFSFTDPTNLTVKKADNTAHPNINASGGCTNCQVGQEASVATYTVTGALGGTLEDPMWYAAKWGGYRNSDGVATGSPATNTDLWDRINNETGAPGADGVPDTFFEVFNPDQLEASLRAVFDSAVSGNNSAPAVSSSQLTEGSFKYVGSFDPTKKTGDLQAFAVTSTGEFSSTPSWSAGTLLRAKPASGANGRQVISNDGNTGFAFTWANVNAKSDYLDRLKGGTLSLTNAQAQAVVNFLRGDAGVEGDSISGQTTAPVIPNRVVLTRSTTNLLGPVVNGSPWLQSGPVAQFSDSVYGGYSNFVSTRRARQKVLWVPSGDGMLHGIKANDGAPLLSYVPGSLVGRLGAATFTDQPITAYVDGSPFTADVKVGSGGSSQWKTYLFSSLGRGGRGLFALDVTDTSALNESSAATLFKWEFNANDDTNLGYVLSDISIEPGTRQAAPVVRLPDGRFALVFGNGHGSATGKAVLFIVPVAGPGTSAWAAGTNYYRIVLDNGTGNGLSTPVLLDADNDGNADTVYAGDLKGNLWKVDISSTTPSSWGSAFKTGTTPKPLFTAFDGSTRLPITAAPQFSFPKMGGVMVTFATGRAILANDFPKTTLTQRVFGIWDRPAFALAATDPTFRGLPPTDASTLVSRTLAISSSDGKAYISSANAIDYTNAVAESASDGWYFDLPDSSEMVVSNLEYRADRVFITSIRPNSNSESCSGQPQVRLYVIDPTLGTAPNSLLGTTLVDGVKYAAIGQDVIDQKIRLVIDATARCTGDAGCLRLVGQNTDTVVSAPRVRSRLQWREVPGLRID
jgi:type IV pilus assembly protein PilY1